MRQVDLNPLIALMATLRDPQGGCSWDLKQSHETLVPMTIEETAELADAVTTGDSAHICEELGDILFHLVFYARIAEEFDQFTMQDVIDQVAAKMIRRHPHIFAGKVYADEAQQKADWDRIKSEEKALKPDAYPHLSALKNVDHLPVLQQSLAMQQQLAKLGFDWLEAAAVFDKIEEEIQEVKAEIVARDKAKIHQEFGDLLFSVLNLGRKLDVDPEMALRHANHKFYSRAERMIHHAGSTAAFEALSLDDKAASWARIKQNDS